MKIAIIGTKGIPAKWGGIEKYVQEIATRLVARGHEVTVFGSRWYIKDFPGKFYKRVRIVKLPSIHLQATDALSNAIWATAAIILGDFDVVHLHGYASYFCVPILKLLKIPTVVTAHGVESGWENPKYGMVARSLLKKAFSVGIRTADKVTAISAHGKKWIAETHGLEPLLTPSGMEEAKPVPPRLIPDKYGLDRLEYLLFLGRIDPIKRVHWLLALDEVLDDNLKVVVAGGAQDSLTERYLSEIMQAADGGERFIFTGPVAGRAKAELLSNCLALVSPSEREGMPITLLEAASYGRCCLVSDIPAHREAVIDGETGYLLPCCNAREFAEGVSRAVTLGSKKLEMLGAAARRHLKQRFDWNDTTSTFIRVYSEVIHG